MSKTRTPQKKIMRKGQATPRTDAFVKKLKGWNQYARAINLAYFCRILERELARAKGKRKKK